MYTNELAYLNHIAAREVTNGMWFLASLFLLASLARFLAPRLAENPRVWSWGVEIKLAWGIALIALGTALRAGWIWLLLLAGSLQDKTAAGLIEQTWSISYIAIGLGIWGAVCTVKAITEASHSSAFYLWTYWLFVIGATIAIPLAVSELL